MREMLRTVLGGERRPAGSSRLALAMIQGCILSQLGHRIAARGTGRVSELTTSERALRLGVPLAPVTFRSRSRKAAITFTVVGIVLIPSNLVAVYLEKEVVSLPELGATSYTKKSELEAPASWYPPSARTPVCPVCPIALCSFLGEFLMQCLTKNLSSAQLYSYASAKLITYKEVHCHDTGILLVLKMREVTMSSTIYTGCGDRVDREMSRQGCNNPSREGHQIAYNWLGSARLPGNSGHSHPYCHKVVNEKSVSQSLAKSDLLASASAPSWLNSWIAGYRGLRVDEAR
ncbi:uncharacterized protein BDR25DRAFT_350764 [Lindgomyces ingoldianus]|uniref:Uncharacterized protein n=1 Tax=Lindgomyces ingoldianus TaxID=673940 RepID=A0ACB6R806_9PLEO|nr:uncharacterized protein BDR25DRAFT_350764 [Lindgomyces ingoldianus]KAF2475389.1 hypothetical protein BDR25DRAFT_350764 [Lindgomyces ingoldianus]